MAKQRIRKDGTANGPQLAGCIDGRQENAVSFDECFGVHSLCLRIEPRDVRCGHKFSFARDHTEVNICPTDTYELRTYSDGYYESYRLDYNAALKIYDVSD